MSDTKPSVLLVPGSTIPGHPWSTALHAIIIDSFRRDDLEAFPPSWKRLRPDPLDGMRGLAEELGPNGHLVVLLNPEQEPLACAGVLPFRGIGWMNNVSSKDSNAKPGPGEAIKAEPMVASDKSVDQFADWEMCCVCVRRSCRGQGLTRLLLASVANFARQHEAERLWANYSVEETGDFWPHMGFKTVPGAEGMLRKGWTLTPGMEGLRADIHFKMGVMALD